MNCVVLDQAEVRNALSIHLEQAMPNTRFVNLDSQVIQIGILLSLLDQRFTVAKADLEDARSLAAEQGCQIEWGGRIIDAIPRPEFSQGTPLRCSHPAPAPYEAANRGLAR